jgi:hypothetical protein
VFVAGGDKKNKKTKSWPPMDELCHALVHVDLRDHGPEEATSHVHRAVDAWTQEPSASNFWRIFEAVLERKRVLLHPSNRRSCGRLLWRLRVKLLETRNAGECAGKTDHYLAELFDIRLCRKVLAAQRRPCKLRATANGSFCHVHRKDAAVQTALQDVLPGSVLRLVHDYM